MTFEYETSKKLDEILALLSVLVHPEQSRSGDSGARTDESMESEASKSATGGIAEATSLSADLEAAYFYARHEANLASIYAEELLTNEIVRIEGSLFAANDEYRFRINGRQHVIPAKNVVDFLVLLLLTEHRRRSASPEEATGRQFVASATLCAGVREILAEFGSEHQREKGYGLVEDDIRTSIHRLRKIIGHGLADLLIETRHAHGYRISTPPGNVHIRLEAPAEVLATIQTVRL